MDRLISLNTVIDTINDWLANSTDDLDNLFERIKAIPSAEYETEITKYSDDEKNKALITLYFNSINCEDKEKRKRYNTAIKLIESIPSIEPKTGYWKMMYEPENMVVCSECGKCAYLYNGRTSTWCPHCGNYKGANE